MCSLFDQNLSPSDLARLIDYHHDPSTYTRLPLNPTVYPKQPITVIMQSDDGFSLQPMRWGIRLRTWKPGRNPRTGKVTPEPTNARDDKLARTWAMLLPSRRCGIPIHRWAEYEGEKGSKRPVWFEAADGGPLLAPGLWDVWEDAETGERLTSVTMVTTEPSALSSRYHDRAPCVLSREAAEVWMDNERYDKDELLEIIEQSKVDTERFRLADR